MGGEGQELQRLQRKQQIFSNAIDAQSTSDLFHPRERFPGQSQFLGHTLAREILYWKGNITKEREEWLLQGEREWRVKQADVGQWEEADAAG